MWTYVKWILPALLALPMLASPARADDEDAPRKLTPGRLRTMLDNLGYDVTEKANENGSPVFTVKISRDTWKFVFQIAFSNDRSMIWLMANLREVPEGGLPPTVTSQMLAKNGTMGRTFFTIQQRWMWLYHPTIATGLTPQVL